MVIRHSFEVTQCAQDDLSDNNGIRTHNHLVRKQTLNHLNAHFKWLSVRLRTK